LTKEFFEESREQSRIKARIVADYFVAWVRIMQTRADRIAYADLYAGPGRYKDGQKSTPLLIIEQAANNIDMGKKLVVLLNDSNPDTARQLEEEINALANVSNLTYKPRVFNEEVSEVIAKELEEIHLMPTITFLDPWGYKGLSSRLIGSVIKDWGCDTIVFFNYNRIRMAINNPKVEPHMKVLFGDNRLIALRQKLPWFQKYQKESEIINAFIDKIREGGYRYIQPYRFVSTSRKCTSHYLLFITKKYVAYKVMKGIMAKHSSAHYHGVPSFEYNIWTRNKSYLIPPYLSISDLENMLLSDFKGKSIFFGDLFDRHNVDKTFIEANYKEAIINLERQNKIKVEPSEEERMKRKGKPTLSSRVKITF